MSLSLLLAFAATTAASYPEVAVTDAFRNVCLANQTEAQMLAAARAEGWQPHIPPQGSPFQVIVDVQKSWAEESGVSSRVSTFTRNVDGVTLSLLIDHTAPFKNWASRIDCGVFDFNAKSRLSDSVVSNVRSEPAAKSHTSENIWFREWESADSKTALRIAFVPANSPFVKQIGIVGSTLQASYNLETN